MCCLLLGFKVRVRAQIWHILWDKISFSSLAKLQKNMDVFMSAIESLLKEEMIKSNIFDHKTGLSSL